MPSFVDVTRTAQSQEKQNGRGNDWRPRFIVNRERKQTEPAVSWCLVSHLRAWRVTMSLLLSCAAAMWTSRQPGASAEHVMWNRRYSSWTWEQKLTLGAWQLRKAHDSCQGQCLHQCQPYFSWSQGRILRTKTEETVGSRSSLYRPNATVSQCPTSETSSQQQRT